MTRVAVVGEHLLVQGYTLAGALAVAAGTPQEVIDAVASLPDDVGVLVLTAAAAAALADDPSLLGGRLTAVMPP